MTKIQVFVFMFKPGLQIQKQLPKGECCILPSVEGEVNVMSCNIYQKKYVAVFTLGNSYHEHMLHLRCVLYRIFYTVIA